MKNELDKMLRFLTKRMILRKDFYDFCLVLKIKISDWPKYKIRDIAELYESIRLDAGHEIAAVQVSGYLAELEGEDFTEEAQSLAAQYHLLLKVFKARDLSRKIMAEPEQVEKHIADFALQKNQEDLIHFGKTIEPTFLDVVKRARIGQVERSIGGWHLLSSLIGGFNGGRVGMILAATGFGKTTLSVNLSLRASASMKVVYFNMEMTSQDFAEKLILASTDIEYRKLKSDPESLKEKIAECYVDNIEKHLFFSPGKALSVQDIFAICRRHSKEHNGIDMIVVDYDQKLIFNLSREMPEWKALQVAVEQFEMLAKELNCYVLILAQESEGGDVSGSKRSKFPASTVMRFYKMDEPDLHGQDVYLIEAIKNRFGKRNARVRVNYEPEKSKVSEQGEFEQFGSKERDQGFTQKHSRVLGARQNPTKTWVDRD